MLREMGLKRLATSVVAIFAILATPLTASAASDDDWVFEGGGWGHGVGLSQYGARGQAQEGRSAEQILKHYYQGISLANMPSDHWTRQADGLWVGLVSNTSSVNLTAVGGPIEVCQPAPGCEHTSHSISPGESWRFEVGSGSDAGKCRFRHVDVTNTGYGECSATISASPSNRVKVNSSEYGRGTVRFDPSSSGFHAVVTLDMEAYLYGLAEVPSSWPSAALQAQAIIGRSYALATAVARGGSNGASKWSLCGCHIRSTSADQVYAGWSKEGTAWNNAVDGTNRKIAVHSQSGSAFNVATTYYSSSNGGASENVEDVFGGSAQPWLKSVNDPWSADPNINPLAKWSVKVRGSDIASVFGWASLDKAEFLSGPPGVRVRFTGKKNGATVEKILTGWEIRRDLLNPLGHGYQPVLGGNTSVRVSPYISSIASPIIFIDTIGHTFELAIDWMYEEGITVGCNPPDNDRYCPNDTVTRGQMAVFVSRVLGLPSPSGDYFDDDNGKFYESAANRLYEAGITVGCDEGRFCGDQRMTRGQMAAFMIRALDNAPAASKDYFVDDNGSIFEKAINQMAEAKITLGCNPPANDRYCPNDNVTRGQMAAFFRRAWGP
jgi:peptidoglycan hydrolase-like amidase